MPIPTSPTVVAPIQVGVPSVPEVVNDIKLYGRRVGVRGMETTELQSATVSCIMGMFPWRRGMSTRFATAESLGYLSGQVDFDLLKQAAPHADHSLFTGVMAYGPRMKADLRAAVAELSVNPTSRRAVVHVSKPRDKPNDVPCTRSLVPLIRRGHLDLDVAMRSWDVVWGMPYDFAGFGAVGLALAWALGVLPGTVTVHAASLHVYDATAHLAVDTNEVGTVELSGVRRLPRQLQYAKSPQRWAWLRNKAVAGLFDAHQGSWNTVLDVRRIGR